jgi:hypothetical protein
MSTIQAFYNYVISSKKPSNPYMVSLLRLTRISIDNVLPYPAAPLSACFYAYCFYLKMEIRVP